MSILGLFSLVATFGVSTPTAATIATIIIRGGTTAQIIARLSAVGVATIVISGLLSIGLSYLSKKFLKKAALEAW